MSAKEFPMQISQWFQLVALTDRSCLVWKWAVFHASTLLTIDIWPFFACKISPLWPHLQSKASAEDPSIICPILFFFCMLVTQYTINLVDECFSNAINGLISVKGFNSNTIGVVHTKMKTVIIHSPSSPNFQKILNFTFFSFMPLPNKKKKKLHSEFNSEIKTTQAHYRITVFKSQHVIKILISLHKLNDR